MGGKREGRPTHDDGSGLNVFVGHELEKVLARSEVVLGRAEDDLQRAVSDKEAAQDAMRSAASRHEGEMRRLLSTMEEVRRERDALRDMVVAASVPRAERTVLVPAQHAASPHHLLQPQHANHHPAAPRGTLHTPPVPQAAVAEAGAALLLRPEERVGFTHVEPLREWHAAGGGVPVSATRITQSAADAEAAGDPAYLGRLAAAVRDASSCTALELMQQQQQQQQQQAPLLCPTRMQPHATRPAASASASASGAGAREDAVSWSGLYSPSPRLPSSPARAPLSPPTGGAAASLRSHPSEAAAEKQQQQQQQQEQKQQQQQQPQLKGVSRQLEFAPQSSVGPGGEEQPAAKVDSASTVALVSSPLFERRSTGATAFHFRQQSQQLLPDGDDDDDLDTPHEPTKATPSSSPASSRRTSNAAAGGAAAGGAAADAQREPPQQQSRHAAGLTLLESVVASYKERSAAVATVCAAQTRSRGQEAAAAEAEASVRDAIGVLGGVREMLGEAEAAAAAAGNGCTSPLLERQSTVVAVDAAFGSTTPLGAEEEKEAADVASALRKVSCAVRDGVAAVVAENKSLKARLQKASTDLYMMRRAECKAHGGGGGGGDDASGGPPCVCPVATEFAADNRALKKKLDQTLSVLADVQKEKESLEAGIGDLRAETVLQLQEAAAIVASARPTAAQAQAGFAEDSVRCRQRHVSVQGARGADAATVAATDARDALAAATNTLSSLGALLPAACVQSAALGAKGGDAGLADAMGINVYVCTDGGTTVSHVEE